MSKLLNSAASSQLLCAGPLSTRLWRRGFADSKKLTEARREELFAGLLRENKLGWAADSLTASFISEQMLRACVDTCC